MKEVRKRLSARVRNETFELQPGTFLYLKTLFKDTKQLGRLGFQFTVLKYLDVGQVDALLKKGNQFFAKGFMAAFNVPDEENPEFSSLMFILCDLLKQPNLNALLGKSINNLRKKSLEKAASSGEEEKAQDSYNKVQIPSTEKALIKL